MFLQQNTINGLRIYFFSSLIDQFSETEIKLMFKTFVMDRMSMSDTDFMLSGRGSGAEVRFSESELLHFRSIVKRLKDNEPFQYILGRTEFYGLELMCDYRALIPRPETEELVYWIVSSMEKGRNEEYNMVDVCSGSGCIALALKSALPNAKVEAWELSEEAIELLHENRDLTELGISIITMDALSDSYPESTERYDVIVSNPPYIPNSERSMMEANVLEFEPDLALFVDDDDPFIFYNKIASESKGLLAEHGWLYFEIHEDFEEEMEELLRDHGFVNIELRKDLQERSRMIRGQRVPSQHE
ncbi:MAG: peptide chain release factor N(5)-glutamine methyltransferase [Crocinitomicaceae bacterium]|nr:peptide chain release factor N(5)-glutamine methyltransferase [Crocinitomicaceae bacterium]